MSQTKKHIVKVKPVKTADPEHGGRVGGGCVPVQ